MLPCPLDVYCTLIWSILHLHLRLPSTWLTDWKKNSFFIDTNFTEQNFQIRNNVEMGHFSDPADVAPSLPGVRTWCTSCPSRSRRCTTAPRASFPCRRTSSATAARAAAARRAPSRRVPTAAAPACRSGSSSWDRASCSRSSPCVTSVADRASASTPATGANSATAKRYWNAGVWVGRGHSDSDVVEN